MLWLFMRNTLLRFSGSICDGELSDCGPCYPILCVETLTYLQVHVRPPSTQSSQTIVRRELLSGVAKRGSREKSRVPVGLISPCLVLGDAQHDNRSCIILICLILVLYTCVVGRSNTFYWANWYSW